MAISNQTITTIRPSNNKPKWPRRIIIPTTWDKAKDSQRTKPATTMTLVLWAPLMAWNRVKFPIEYFILIFERIIPSNNYLLIPYLWRWILPFPCKASLWVSMVSIWCSSVKTSRSNTVFPNSESTLARETYIFFWVMKAVYHHCTHGLCRKRLPIKTF